MQCNKDNDSLANNFNGYLNKCCFNDMLLQ